VRRVSHVGDCGLPAALVLSRLGPAPGGAFSDPSALSPRELSALYVDAKRRVAGGGAEAARVGALLCELQGALAAGDGRGSSGDYGGSGGGGSLPLLPAWAALCSASQRGYAPLFQRLGVAVEERGEACYAPAVSGVLRELQGAGVAVEDAGALVVRGVGAPGEPPLLVRKANGGFLYASVDLACLRERLVAGFGRIVYVTDAAQAPHFRALFATARAAGWVGGGGGESGAPPTNLLHPARRPVVLQHAAFGVVAGESGKKLSSRDGTEATLGALLDEGAAWALRVLEEGTGGGGASLRGAPSAQRAALAERVSASAIRFFDLTHKRDGGYAFSMERAFSLKGGSAAYPLYALARLRGVREAAAAALGGGGGGNCGVASAGAAAAAWVPLLEGARARAGGAPAPPPPLTPHERELALAVAALGEAVEDTARTLQPHLLAGHVLATATAFHAFYAGERVLQEARGGGVDWRAAEPKMALCAAAEVALRAMLELCGVAQVERM
jgi:arginyl-tRNA synthetase